MRCHPKTEVIVIGAGFSGLSAAYELAKNGISVTILEAEAEIGGLAASFRVGGTRLDRFYHHWFTNDVAVMELIGELDLTHRIQTNATNTGIYYANNYFRLSSPWDLLNFDPLPFVDRIRLGVLALRARNIKDWMALESKTAKEWLKDLGGEKAYKVVWEPLLKGKFGPYADQISAVWFWNKLKLRGSSRGKAGAEQLVYFKGGFVELADAISLRILQLGGRIKNNSAVLSIKPVDGVWQTITKKGLFTSDHVITTVALPLIAEMVNGWASKEYISSLNRIKYLANICLVLELNCSLSNTYWLNINDPNFPFVGVIEHTNFERPETYGGKHIVYLSKYLPHTDPIYSMGTDEFLDFAFPYLQKMFPDLRRSWIKRYHLWRARWSQPVVERYYSKMIPSHEGPIDGFHICSMAQIYPQDRGTNYAIKEGRTIGQRIFKNYEDT